MATFSRHASFDKISQPRQGHGVTQQPASSFLQQQQHHLHQPYQPGSKSFSSHSHQPSANITNSNHSLLNTEIRAQARREREATREKSKEMLLSGQTGRERSSSILSNQQHGAEKKISPKGTAKANAGGDNRIGATGPRLTAPRHAHKTSTSAGSEYTAQKPASRPPILTHTSLDRRSFEDVTAQRQPFSDMASRIPSPPKEDDKRDLDSIQSAYFVKYYYNIVDKCHSWQKYATQLKIKSEALELENRILKGLNEEQSHDIRKLQMEVFNLKQATMVHEHERRRAESKRMSPVDSSGDLSGRYMRQATSNTALQGEANMESINIPSPPTSNRLLDPSNRLPVNMAHPYCSSNLNLHGSDSGEMTRPPTPTSAISLPHSLQAVLQGDGEGLFLQGARHRLEGNAGEFVGQQESTKLEAAATLSYEYDCFQQIQQQVQSRGGGTSYTMTASNTFPPAGNTPSAALTVQALAAMNRQTEDHSLQTSVSVPQLPSQVWDRPLSPNRVAKRQVSAGEGSLVAPSTTKPSNASEKGADKENVHVTHLTLPGYNQEAANTSGKAGSGATSSGEGEGQTMVRGGSSLSDAATVTGDYLHDIVEQRRRLRKVSQSQQQQLHHLQARVHLNSNASQASIHSATGGVSVGGSRPSSRLSNYGTTRGKSRSRAGSYTLHDSIPVAKDDVFSSSDALLVAPIKRAGTMPLASLDVNIHSHQPNKVDQWVKAEAAAAPVKEQQQQQQLSLSPPTDEIASSVVDSDPKGAHRRLYIRLRDELETADLVRFERYVHRYDALEIGVEGSRGIINRVRRLLLPEELVASKLAFPDKYRLRKELAREFERIVREDALPKEQNSQEVLIHSDMVRRDDDKYH